MRAAFTASKVFSNECPKSHGLKTVTEPYQGVSGPLTPHRHSGSRLATKSTGTPMLAATCATAESTLTTTSHEAQARANASTSPYWGVSIEKGGSSPTWSE